MLERKEFVRKQVDDVLGGAKAWENVDSTNGKRGLYLLTLHTNKRTLPQM